MWVLVLGFFAFFFNCFPWVLLSIIPQRQSDRPGREGVLVRNVKTMRLVYWVNASESSGAGSPGCSQIKGR